MLITGASQGIGKAIAIEAGLKGVSHLILVSRSFEKLESVKREIHAQQSEIVADVNSYARYSYSAQASDMRIDIIKADLSREEECKKLIVKTEDLVKEANLSDNGGIDFLILNHITNSEFGLWLNKHQDPDTNELDLHHHKRLQSMFQTNTFSYIWITTAAINILQQNDGQIVVVSSLAGHVGVPNTAAYSSTKHALHGFFNALRVELGMMKLRIGITMAAIGATDTEGAKEVKKQLTSVKWDDAAGAAQAILRGAALKKREIYHPHHKVFPAIFLYNLAPFFIDSILSSIYEQKVTD